MEHKTIKGTCFIDERGILTAFNNFSMEKIKRMYQIEHPNQTIIRAWQGHKIENKWFYVIQGSFSIAYVLIDNFENPSRNLTASFMNLKAEDNVIFSIPRGHANGLRALEPDSKVIVFSDLTLEKAKNDNFKFDSHLWLDWSKLDL